MLTSDAGKMLDSVKALYPHFKSETPNAYRIFTFLIIARYSRVMRPILLSAKSLSRYNQWNRENAVMKTMVIHGTVQSGLKAVVIHCWLRAREILDYCTRSWYQARENTGAELELGSKRGKTWDHQVRK